MAPGELAIVLHTHMPYVEGFGTWPFGEEWLWEAIATCYLPLLDVLDGHEGPPPLTLSLTPVLADQLEHPGAMERCLAFLTEIRPESHRRDIAELEAAGEPALAAALRALGGAVRRGRRAAGAARGDRRWSAGRAGRHATWTSSATHAVLPLLATDSGIDLQVQTGIASHRRRFGGWGGGFWLPECAHAPWLDPLLEAAGARAACVELTGLSGLGDPRHLRPLATDDGPVLWPVDRATMALVWGEGGYPSQARLPRLPPPHHASPSRLADRRRARMTRPPPRRRRGPTPRTSSAASRAGSPTAACASARWTPSCSATGGTRGSPGCRPCWRRRRSRGWR